MAGLKKILWMTFGGSWIEPLINQIKTEVLLEVIIPTSGKTYSRLEKSVKFHYIHVSRSQYVSKMDRKIANLYLPIINDFAPDLIHIHGTEHNLGQIHRFCPNIPVVISIQGILIGCLPYSKYDLTDLDMKPYKSLKNLIGRGGLSQMSRIIQNSIDNYELDILKHSKFFFCRTKWDTAWVNKLNPQAYIYRGEELLRDFFYFKAGFWDIMKCTRHRIFMPSGFNPIKGLHHAVKAVAMLKKKWPDVNLHVPGIEKKFLSHNKLRQILFGEEYIRYVLKMIKDEGLENNIVFLPRLDARQMVNEMLSANVFLSPSSIDNSPNTIGEAMMLGVPIVSTPVGGVPSFIEHEKNGLLAQPNQLAENINRLFQNDKFAMTLGRAAYSTALKRHSCETAKQQYLKAYDSIIANTNFKK